MKRLLLLFSFTIIAMVNNLSAQGTCATAVTLTPGTQQCGDTATGGDTFDDNICLGSYDGGDDFLYVITVPAGNNGNALELTLTSTGSWTGIAISEGCPEAGGGVCFGASTSSAGNEMLISDPLTGGNTYYIHISTWPTPQSVTFCLDAMFVVPPSPPANDLCSGAISVPVDLLSCTSGNTTGTNISATDSGEIAPCGFGTYSGGDVWYSFTVPAGNSVVEIDFTTTFGSLYGEVYSGSCGALTAVYCSNFLSSTTNEVIAGLTPGQTYLFRIFESGNDSDGTFEFCMFTPPPPPINDDCAGAIAFPGTLGPDGSCPANSFSLDLSSATNTTDGNFPSCDATGNYNVWYTIVAPSSGILFESGTGLPGMAIYSGTCGALTEIGCLNNSTGTVTGLTPGATYIIQIWDDTAGNTVDFCLSDLPSAPANDLCSGAIAVTVDALACSSPNTTGTNLATSDSGEIAPCGAGTYSGGDVWYSFTVPAGNTVVEIDFTTTFGSLYGEIYSGSCGALTAVYCSNFLSSTTNEVIAGLTPGQTYLFRIFESGNDASGTFEFCMFTPPPPPINDNCTGAIPYPGTIGSDGTCPANSFTADISAATETSDSNYPSCDAFGNYNLWYTYTATATQLDFESGTGAPGIAVYSGTCGALTELGCLNNVSGSITGLTIGATYIFQVWDDTATASFDFCLSEPACAPPAFTVSIASDDCPTSAVFQASIDVSSYGSIGMSNIEISDDQGTASEVVNPGPGTPFSHVFPSSGTLYAAGTTVMFTVSDLAMGCSTTVSYTFPSACPPSNDMCANAIPLTVGSGACAGAITADNTAATSSNLSVSCGSFGYNGGDVWYSVVVPPSGNVNIETSANGPITDTTMEIFTDCTASTSVECDDDDSAAGAFSLIELTGQTPGATLYIAVWEYGNNSFGTFDICAWEPCAGSTNLILTMGMTTTAMPTNSCDDPSGWTYYEDPGTGNYIFAINWAPDGSLSTLNAAAKAAAQVEITVAPMDGMADDGTNATWTMKRYWNVLGSGAFDEPVNVRFYYDPVDKAATTGAADADPRPREVDAWFKTVGTPWDGTPDAVNPDATNIELTDVCSPCTENGITFAQFDGLASFSGGTWASGVGTAGASVLPIELLSFKASENGASNMIEWTTASEINNDYMMVQKSDGNARWTEVGRVASEGDTNRSRAYELVDTDPYQVSYYRLMSVDLDGSTGYSEVVKVDRGESERSWSAKAVPNPVTDMLTVNLEYMQSDVVDLILYDLSGRAVKQIHQNLDNNAVNIELDMTDLESGLYLLNINSADQQQTLRIVKN